MVLASLALLLAPAAALAASIPLQRTAALPASFAIENLVTFGDSYTDEARLTYMKANHKLPPTDSMLPASDHTWSGGYAWGRLVANRTGARYYDYAVAGAMCADALVPRRLNEIDAPFPSVRDYELSAFDQGLQYDKLYPDRRDDNTVYALWIGTNDLGIDGFLGDRENAGQTLDSFVDCVWDVFDRIYETGGRRFVLMTELPLETAPMYARPAGYGHGNDRYWADPSAYDVKAYLDRLAGSIKHVNEAFRSGADKYQHNNDGGRWQDATLSIFNVHQLWLDVRADPDKYLDAPADIDGAYRNCVNDCVYSQNPRTSFMWYDELHPSQRMEEIFASNFIDVVQGKSKYGTDYCT
ncbi:hypothetical protein JDV02_003755 [Purpureocillium takamizusanense]|uniref:Acetyl esterase n=1 Tax=Purpureocillium takamizusanense TaxID=2060973 RepID=A0A9Q8QDG2_9HYPO|nr:uncharacterized protein JDV02_003755 [Purpureocillium takamizusanense]UNI17413.1 hypothetical protein JDV02_003755 [Purpureocillium takamizusanense]